MKTRSKVFIFIFAAFISLSIILIAGGSPWAVRAGLGIIIAGLFLFVTEPIPMPLTALLILIALSVGRVAPPKTILSGFFSNSLFLITAGFIMAAGVNSTPLIKRAAYFLLIKSGGTPAGSLLGILILLQLMAFFIPASAVKLTLVLPVMLNLTDTLPPGRSNIKTALLLGLAFGVNITSIGLLPGALSNVVAAELIGSYTGTPITYLQWMLYNLPLGLLLIPVLWKVLLWRFPPERDTFPGGLEHLTNSLKDLGPMLNREKRCIGILALTIILWLAESIHGWHPYVPALIAVFLMVLPGLGIVPAEKALAINWGTIVLAGTNISIGAVVMVTGSSAFLAGLFFPPALSARLFSDIFTAILFMAVFTQVFHKLLGNVVTLVITLLPIVLVLSLRIPGSTLLLGLVVAASALCGFMLVVESLPNIIVYSTGLVSKHDFLTAGGIMTVFVILSIALMSLTWWPLVGLR